MRIYIRLWLGRWQRDIIIYIAMKTYIAIAMYKYIYPTVAAARLLWRVAATITAALWLRLSLGRDCCGAVAAALLIWRGGCDCGESYGAVAAALCPERCRSVPPSLPPSLLPSLAPSLPPSLPPAHSPSLPLPPPPSPSLCN
jgi:hypothetical protein